MIETAPLLRIVSRHGVGYDAVDVPALDARGIPLATVGDVNSHSVAEHTLALILALAKRVTLYDEATRHERWATRNSLSATELHGKRLLLVGFGRIGRLVAGMAAAFGIRVSAYDPLQAADIITAAGAEQEHANVGSTWSQAMLEPRMSRHRDGKHGNQYNFRLSEEVSWRASVFSEQPWRPRPLRLSSARLGA